MAVKWTIFHLFLFLFYYLSNLYLFENGVVWSDDRVETIDGSAVEGEDYVAINEGEGLFPDNLKIP